MLTIRRFQTGDADILSTMIRRTLREVNYTSPKSELDYLIYNDPGAYAELILSGDPEKYLKVVTEYKPFES